MFSLSAACTACNLPIISHLQFFSHYTEARLIVRHISLFRQRTPMVKKQKQQYRKKKTLKKISKGRGETSKGSSTAPLPSPSLHAHYFSLLDPTTPFNTSPLLSQTQGNYKSPKCCTASPPLLSDKKNKRKRKGCRPVRRPVYVDPCAVRK